MRVDTKLLKKQRLQLATLLSENKLGKQQSEALEGIQNLLDAVQDGLEGKPMIILFNQQDKAKNNANQ